MMRTEAEIINLDDYRLVEDIVKQRLGAVNLIFSAEMPNGEILTYIPHQLSDINLVYMIQTFTDRRTGRVNEINS